MRNQTGLWSEQVSSLAQELGATSNEAAVLSAIFDVEGFGGLEYDLRYSAREVVRRELRRLRVIAGR
jgi:hypothetical protein